MPKRLLAHDLAATIAQRILRLDQSLRELEADSSDVVDTILTASYELRRVAQLTNVEDRLDRILANTRPAEPAMPIKEDRCSTTTPKTS